jgi:hypothetical protein
VRNFVFLRRKMHLVNYRVRGTTYIVDYERWRESHAEDERGKSRSVTAAPAIIPKKTMLCVQIYCYTRLSCERSAGGAVGSPRGHLAAPEQIRSARSGVACVTARVTHPCSTVLLTRGTTDGCQLTM